MSSFWENLDKFPRFLISVLAGFFLTTFKTFFKQLKNTKSKISLIVVITIIIITTYTIIKKMTGIE
uniref:Ycf33 n=1 Tax=Laurencia catarinensis TaxID=197326 RepID=UPI0028D14AB8|nr:Ycf33 [Laurencia catarinensis]WMP12551.1 Ycf33 [Laurencia catarinensis]